MSAQEPNSPFFLVQASTFTVYCGVALLFALTSKEEQGQAGAGRCMSCAVNEKLWFSFSC